MREVKRRHIDLNRSGKPFSTGENSGESNDFTKDSRIEFSTSIECRHRWALGAVTCGGKGDVRSVSARFV